MQKSLINSHSWLTSKRFIVAKVINATPGLSRTVLITYTKPATPPVLRFPEMVLPESYIFIANICPSIMKKELLAFSLAIVLSLAFAFLPAQLKDAATAGEVSLLPVSMFY